MICFYLYLFLRMETTWFVRVVARVCVVILSWCVLGIICSCVGFGCLSRACYDVCCFGIIFENGVCCLRFGL